MAARTQPRRQQGGQDEGHHGNQRRHDEDIVETARHGSHQTVDHARFHAAAQGGVHQPVDRVAGAGEPPVDDAIEDRAEHGGPKRLAHHAREDVRRRGDAAPVPVDARLDRDQERGVAEAQPDTHDERTASRPQRPPRRIEGDQDETAGDQREPTEDRRQPVRRPHHQPSGDDAGERPANRHGREDEARHGDTAAHHALDVGRQERRDRHQDRADGERPGVADRDHAIAPQVDRHHGLLDVAFVADEGDQGTRRDHRQGGQGQAGQIAHLRHRQHQSAGRRDQQERAEIVDAVAALLHALGQEQRQHEDRRGADRQVDPEHQRPAQLLDQEGAEDGTDQPGHAPDAREIALLARAFLGRIDVAHHRARDRRDGARAQSLQRPKADQGDHAPSEAAQKRAHQEQPHAEEEHGLAPVDVGQASVDGNGHGLGQQVGHEHPAQQAETAQLRDDGRHGGRDDGAFDRGREHRQHGGGQHRPPLGLERPAKSSASSGTTPTTVSCKRYSTPQPRGRAAHTLTKGPAKERPAQEYTDRRGYEGGRSPDHPLHCPVAVRPVTAVFPTGNEVPHGPLAALHP